MTDSLIIVDDDERLALRLAQAMEKRGFQVTVAGSVADGIAAIETAQPTHAVVDLRLKDGSGLDVVKRLHEVRPQARAVVLRNQGALARTLSHCLTALDND